MKLSLRSPCPVRPTLSPTGDCKSACALCTKTVHHLSRMTEAEGRALLASAEGQDLCVRYVQDRSGSVVFAPALRQAAAAGMLAFTPVAFADGGDVLVQQLAEQQRIQNELRALGVPGDQVTVGAIEAQDNAAKAADASAQQTHLDPEPYVMWDGGI